MAEGNFRTFYCPKCKKETKHEISQKANPGRAVCLSCGNIQQVK